MKDIKFTATFNARCTAGTRTRPFKGAKVFVTTNADPIVDTAFTKTDLHSVPFKSVAWKRLSSKATKLISTAIRTHYDLPTENVSIAFSHHCGCSMCPCSPGFNVKARNVDGHELLKSKGIYNASVFADIKFESDTLAPLTSALDTFFVEYENEKREYNAQQDNAQ